MKSCPFCKEEIRDDALKCRYCQSALMLLTADAPGAAPVASDANRVTYVLDRGLLRFAKFAVAILAIFLVVGAYLFGFKLESSLEKVRQVQDQVKLTSEKLKESQQEMEAARATVNKLKVDVERVLAEANAHLGDISQRSVDSAAMVAAIVISARKLSPVEETVALQKRSDVPTLARAGQDGKYWKSGATLRVRFLGGTASSKKMARDTLAEWAQHANLTFEFVSDGGSEIRIAFKSGEGSWSYVGTDALIIAQDQPTMNFGWVDRSNFLHEFGHVFGLIEEHQNPAANIRWDKEKVYSALSGPPNHWSRQQIDHNVLAKLKPSQVGEYRSFDPKSIMIRVFPAEWTGGTALGGTEKLSDSDKALVARLYPRS